MQVLVGWLVGWLVDSIVLMVLQSAGPHIYQTCPSANYYDCKAMAIGARSQSARTYLEKYLDQFPECEATLQRMFHAHHLSANHQ